MWAGVEPLGTHLSRLIRTWVPGRYSGDSLESFGPGSHPTSVYLAGIAQWLWYKTGGSEPLDLGRGH